MGTLTVGLAPGFLDEPPYTGAGRVHHSVVAELYPNLARRPRPWRSADVWLTKAAGDEFPTRQPVAVICHGAEWLLDPSLFDMTPPEYWKPLIARVERGVRAATVTIVPSEYTRRAIITGWEIDPDRVVAVHHGVDTQQFSHRPGGRALVAGALGEDRPYILFVGVPSVPKGIRELKAAIGLLARDGYPHALVIAGPRKGLQPPEWRDEVGTEIDGAPGRLAWIEDARDDRLIPLMSDAVALCLPSVKESFGLPTLEAMACSTPVVVANRAALPEVVGEAGLVCEATADGVAEALRRLIDDPGLARELGERGRARAETRTWSHTARGWLAALERAASMVTV